MRVLRRFLRRIFLVAIHGFGEVILRGHQIVPVCDGGCVAEPFGNHLNWEPLHQFSLTGGSQVVEQAGRQG